MEDVVSSNNQYFSAPQEVAPAAPAPKKPLTPEERAKFMKRLTKTQWIEAKAMWATGEFTLTQLSQKFGITREALSRRFTKDKVVKGSKAIEQSVRAKLEAAAATDSVEQIRKIKETKEEGYAWARQLGAQVMRKVVQAAQAGGNYGLIMRDLMALESATRSIKTTTEQRWLILGLDKDLLLDEELPELKIVEMTAEEVDAQRRSQAESEEFVDVGSIGDDPESEDAPDEPVGAE